MWTSKCVIDNFLGLIQILVIDGECLCETGREQEFLLLFTSTQFCTHIWDLYNVDVSHNIPAENLFLTINLKNK